MPRTPAFNPSVGYGGGGGGGDRIIDIIMRGGQQNSELISRGGDIWSRGIGQATDAAVGGVQAYQKDQEEQKKKAVLKAQDDAFIARLGDTANPLTPQETIKIYGNAEKGLAIHKAYESLLTPKPDEKVIMAGMEAGTPELRAAAWPAVRAHAIAAGGEPVKAAMPEQYDEGWWQKYVKARSGPEKLTDHDPTHALVGPAGNVVLPAVPEAPKPVKPQSLEDELINPATTPQRRAELLATKRDLATAGRDPSAGQKDKIWVVRDGKALRIGENEYRPGDLPANTREQGRPVTSGDAGKIAELDTSLDDLNKLSGSVGSGATGVAAKAGVMLPNFVTEWTGIGADAKAKQATIDRVKQVIGKALEGGVLRKEDELKYEKILPTIGDPPQVAAAKMEGLWKAIEKKRQTTLDALGDAGYDITKFSARAQRTQEKPGSAPGKSFTVGKYSVEVE